MHYYLASFVGGGSFLDPRRAAGADQPGATIIDLSPASVALVGMPVRSDGPGQTYLGNDAVTPSAAVRNAVQSRLGLTLATAGGLAAIVAELLTAHARTDGSRWRPLRAAGWLNEVWLGGELLTSWPAVAGAFGDNFNRADGALGNPWTVLQGSVTVVSNKAKQASINATDSAYIALSTVNHQAQVDATLNNFVTDLCLRQAIVLSGGDFDRYFGRCWGDGATNDQLVKLLAGTGTTLGTATGATHAAGATVTQVASVDGSTVKFQSSGSLITVTDTAITGPARVLIEAYVPSSSAAQWDNFLAGDLHAALPAPPARIRRALVRSAR